MKVIGIDLGGTKVHAAVVESRGKILAERKVGTDLAGGWTGLKRQLVEICRELMQEQRGVKAVGIGSAGPLHAPSGRLLDPTNFGWTKPLAVKVTSDLQKTLQLPVLLENDAAAAVLAEHWRGNGGDNCVVLTLGTGLGLGVMANGRLVRGGRGLHPEGGHLVLKPGDPTAQCGCGVYGCAEAYLSGVNFTKRVVTALGNPNLTTLDILDLAKSGNSQVLEFLAEYSELLAQYLLDVIVLFYPEKVRITGSFANAHEQFLPRAEARLRALLARRLKTLPLFPQIRTSKLGNRAGVLGAAFLALHPHYAD